MTNEGQAGLAGAQASEQPSADQILQQIGRDYLQSGVYQQSIADRTGELMEAAHKVAAELRKAKVAGVTEPGTETDALIVFDGLGGVHALPDTVFDSYRDNPKHRAGVAIMTRIESFIDHVNRFKSVHSAIFAQDNMTAPRLTAVLDYHPEGPDDAVHAAFTHHRSVFAFPLSDEWQAWTKFNTAKMGLADFAEFLEERFIDVEQVEDITRLNDDIGKLIANVGLSSLATPTRLMELSRGLAIHENSAVVEVRNLSSGEGEVRFESTHVDATGAPVSIPSLFIITIPVFARGDFYRIAARLRYRKTSGGLVFWYELWGADRVFEQAFTEACELARDKTLLPLLYGTAE